VIPEFRNQGIGTRLMGDFENWLREKGIKSVDLKVLSNNTKAVELYKSLKYVTRVDLMCKNIS